MNSPNSTETTGDKLAFTRSEACHALRISSVTLWRLEKLGHIRSVPVPGLTIKIYPRAEIERFLSLPKAGGAR